jgi:diaminohydroxyphosphoribosylaminopyrimidine deaminase/5-amino-6-(5-phosphoribosylamino)uracil reductase
LILRSGIRRVVVSVSDPNPRHNGKGIEILRRAGINVTEGVCKDEGSALVKPFRKWVRSGLPYLTLKLGMSVDGKIADGRKKSRWITSAQSRRLVMRLRRKSDAILVGSGTVAADNPSLLTGRRGVQPLRVVVDSWGSIDRGAIVLNDDQASRTVIATTGMCPGARRRAYAKNGSQVWCVPQAGDRVSLKHVLRKLGRLGVLAVLCEGGGNIAHSLIRNGLVDEYIFFLAPVIIGGSDGVPSVGGKSWPLASAPRLKFVEVIRSGSDVMLRALPAWSNKG